MSEGISFSGCGYVVCYSHGIISFQGFCEYCKFPTLEVIEQDLQRELKEAENYLVYQEYNLSAKSYKKERKKLKKIYRKHKKNINKIIDKYRIKQKNFMSRTKMNESGKMLERFIKILHMDGHINNECKNRLLSQYLNLERDHYG